MTDTLSQTLKDSINATFNKLVTNVPGFKKRPAQVRMIRYVAQVMSREKGRIAIEAPTGTGKSMGYMVPTILIGQDQERQVVLSTATVALQEQIYNRDLPAFLKATGIDATTALVKGRNRYACPEKMIEMSAGDKGITGQEQLFDDVPISGAWPRKPEPGEVDQVARLTQALADDSWDGDLDRPPEKISDTLLPLLSMPAPGCMNRRCPHFSNCPLFLARKKVADADVVVANHDIVIASLKQALEQENDPDSDTTNFLSTPSESLYVFDEGHTLNDIVINSTKAEIHLGVAHKQVTQMHRLAEGTYRLMEKTEASAQQHKTFLEAIADTLKVLKMLDERINQEWTPDPKESNPIWRAANGLLPEEWKVMAKELGLHNNTLATWFHQAQKEIKSLGDDSPMIEKLMRQLRMTRATLRDYGALWLIWGYGDDDGTPRARWVHKSMDGSLVLNGAEVSAGNWLRRALWPTAGGVVVTSATLSTGGDFGLLRRELAMPADMETTSLPSPFNLQEQAELVVPRIKAMPRDQGFDAELTAWMENGLDWDRAGLVLFTSRARMMSCANQLAEKYRAKVMVQGELPRTEMLDKHKAKIERGEGSILFGLLSMGTGLDLSGDLVTQVVVTTLPFQVPTDPIGATHAEWVERCGGNAFGDIALPAATRTLIQFMGRLIRTETDSGQVYLLDRRVVTKGYGRKILNALPPYRRVIH